MVFREYNMEKEPLTEIERAILQKRWFSIFFKTDKIDSTYSH